MIRGCYIGEVLLKPIDLAIVHGEDTISRLKIFA